MARCEWCGGEPVTWRCTRCDLPIGEGCRMHATVCPECRWEIGDLPPEEAALAEAVMPAWLAMATEEGSR